MINPTFFFQYLDSMNIARHRLGGGLKPPPKLKGTPPKKKSLPILYYQKVYRMKLLIFRCESAQKCVISHNIFPKIFSRWGIAHPQTPPLLGRLTYPSQTLPIRHLWSLNFAPLVWPLCFRRPGLGTCSGLSMGGATGMCGGDNVPLNLRHVSLRGYNKIQI